MTLLLLFALAAIFLVLERRWPAAAQPEVHGWWQRVALLNLAQLLIVILAGYSWDRWLQRASFWRLSDHLPPLAAGLIAYAVSCVVYYWWHRFRHESAFFWRVCHQLHHSPRRIELLTSFYKHPVEMTINSLLSSAIVYTFLGCDLRAAAVYTFLTAAAEYFYHWNIKTPRWIGWIIQRPESHRVHHERDRHTSNYADLPVLDWIFGTFENPRRSVLKCGFSPAKEQQFSQMLLFRDVHKPKAPSPTCIGCRKRWACAAARHASIAT